MFFVAKKAVRYHTVHVGYNVHVVKNILYCLYLHFAYGNKANSIPVPRHCFSMLTLEPPFFSSPIESK